MSMVFCDRHFQHFLSLASLFSSWCYICNQQQIRLDLVHFQRSTRDPHCILSCLMVHLRCGRERENCVRREERLIDDDLAGSVMNEKNGQ